MNLIDFCIKRKLWLCVSITLLFLTTSSYANKYDDFKKHFNSKGNADKAVKYVDHAWGEWKDFYIDEDGIIDVNHFFEEMGGLVSFFGGKTAVGKNDRRAIEAIRVFDRHDDGVSIKEAKAIVKAVKDDEAKVKVLELMAGNNAVKNRGRLISYVAPLFNGSKNLLRALEMMSLIKRFDFEKNYREDYSDYTPAMMRDYVGKVSHSEFLTPDLLVYMVAKHVSVAKGLSVKTVLDYMVGKYNIRDLVPLQWNEKRLLQDLCENSDTDYCVKTFRD